MERTKRFFDQLLPQSAFGITLLTFAGLILVATFFVRGIHLVSIHGEPEPGSSPLADRALLPTHDKTEHEPDDLPAMRAAKKKKKAASSTKPDTLARTTPHQPASGQSSVSTPSSRLAKADLVQPAQPYAGRSAIHTPSTKPDDTATDYIATLTRTFECRWAEDSPALTEGAKFKVGQTLNIAAGLVEIVFACGATAILEGPAVLELESGTAGALHVGKLTANVPDDVEGFTVHTPTASIVSLCSSQPRGVAKLTATSDCLWGEGNAVAAEGDCIMPGQTLKLLDGLAEITFSSGAKIILQGPADLQIDTSKSATLHSGRMTADVPDDLEGFRIRTAVAEILSLPAEPKPPPDEK